MLKRVILIAALLLVIASSLAFAQDGGQFCVRAFEDRNSNGTRDASEPFLTRGIIAELANPDGVVTASATLEDSQTSAAGVICFSNLPNGAYMLIVTSAEYHATTANTLAATVTSGELPVVLEYGGVARVVDTGAAAGTASSGLDLSSNDGRTLVQRLVFSLLGSLAMVALMVIIGVVVWIAILRPRALNRAKRATSTGQYQAVTRDDMLSMYAPPVDDERDLPR